MSHNVKAIQYYASVLVDAAIDHVLDYAIPPSLVAHIERGRRVQVPLRQQLCGGIVLEVKTTCNYPKAKPIATITDDLQLSEELMNLAEWIARYYATSLRTALRCMLPASVRKEVGHREQLFVSRLKTRQQIQQHIIAIRSKSPAQAAVLEALLPVTKGMLLTELMLATGGSRSPVETLTEQGWIALEKVVVDRSPLDDQEYFITPPKVLTDEQHTALTSINQSVEKNVFQTHLLYGITGSGKTEVYLQAIDKALSLGKHAIMMVPEIALTTQTIERLRSRFKDSIAVLHCRLSDGERYDAWLRMRQGQTKIAIGARSAIFSPLPQLGLIIVDEEHEASYKQNEQMPCYHARDIAVMRGKLCQATVVLGSATPSVESYHNALQGKYNLLSLSKRPDSAMLPRVTIVDMKREYEKAQGLTSFSQPLLDALSQRISKGEQSILFLNRRGYHTLQLCQSCGASVKCNHCDTALTFHLGENCLSCHLCGFAINPPPRCCPTCKSDATMKFRGVGTEHVERALHAIFPEVRTLRIDADTTRHKGSHQQLLRAFGTGKADVLIGTQMIAKGLHFPEVTLAAVLNGDSALHIPDYRSAESTFQLLTQVAGRAGRGVMAGEVIIQTSLPEHNVIQHASQHNFEGFYQEEIASRALFEFPPFAQLVKVSCQGIEQQAVESYADTLRTTILTKLTADYTIHPVIPAAHLKVKDRFRYQFLMRGPAVYPMVNAYKYAMSQLQQRHIAVYADVNPTSTFF
jgi:primosomal protein N' (replication factor Y)